jgi:hypothetical protein
VFNLLKFIVLAAVVAAGTAMAIAVSLVAFIAVINGTAQHLASDEAIDLMGLIAGYLAPWVAAAKFLNFAWWLRRSHKASKRLDFAVSMAYNSPGLYGVRDSVVDAMKTYDEVFREQAGWLAVNRKTALALLEAEWHNARVALHHIDTRSV